MDDGLNCGRNVPGITRQTNALSFYSLGNEVDKERSRTASLIYKSIVIGITPPACANLFAVLQKIRLRFPHQTQHFLKKFYLIASITAFAASAASPFILYALVKHSNDFIELSVTTFPSKQQIPNLK